MKTSNYHLHESPTWHPYIHISPMSGLLFKLYWGWLRGSVVKHCPNKGLWVAEETWRRATTISMKVPRDTQSPLFGQCLTTDPRSLRSLQWYFSLLLPPPLILRRALITNYSKERKEYGTSNYHLHESPTWHPKPFVRAVFDNRSP
jgi:hypothetical protein